MKVSRTASYAGGSGLPDPRVVWDTELTDQITEAMRDRAEIYEAHARMPCKCEAAGIGRRRVGRLMRPPG